MARAYRTRSVILLALAAATGCRSTEHPRVEFMDLLDALPAAERRAARATGEAVRADFAGPTGDIRPAVITEAPARVIWSMRLPAGASLETAVALLPDAQGRLGPGAAARIGISDDRLYEQLARINLDGSARTAGGWQPVTVNLGAYTGWQWSLFYRPWERTWRLIFSADATPGGTIAWARPIVHGRR